MGKSRNTGLFNRTISMALFISLVLAQTGCSADIEAEMTELGSTETTIVSESTFESSMETSTDEETFDTEETTAFTYETIEHTYPFSVSSLSMHPEDVLNEDYIYILNRTAVAGQVE